MVKGVEGFELQPTIRMAKGSRSSLIFLNMKVPFSLFSILVNRSSLHQINWLKINQKVVRKNGLLASGNKTYIRKQNESLTVMHWSFLMLMKNIIFKLFILRILLSEHQISLSKMDFFFIYSYSWESWFYCYLSLVWFRRGSLNKWAFTSAFSTVIIVCGDRFGSWLQSITIQSSIL